MWFARLALALRLGLIRLMQSALILGAVSGLPGAVLAQTTTYSSTTDSAVGGINETATPCTNTFKRTFTVGTSFIVTDANLGVLLAHTYRQDLQFFLTAPDNTRVQIMTGIGAGADNVNLLLDDEAALPVSNYTAADAATAATIAPPFNNTYRPSTALSAFDGKNALGTWTFEVCDNAAQDVGTFFQANLVLTQAATNYADLSLTSSVSNASPASGSSITYTLTATNASGSPLTATGVTVTDLLPAGVSFVSASGTGTYNSATGVWTVGSLTPGQSASLTITATVTASAGATIANPAQISTSGVPDSDSTPNNGVTTEDDYASSSFTVSGARTAGTPPMLTCALGTTVLDWDSVAWTAGSTANSYPVTNIGTVALNVTNPGAWLNNATYGGQSPARQNAVTGGFSPAQFSIMELVDLASISDSAATTITLPTAVPGVQFRIFDVDYSAGQFADRVTVTGSFNGSQVTPLLTNGISNYVIGNSAYGDATSADAQVNGNIVVTFNSPVDTITVAYGNHALAPANPGQQAITLHDITFCRPQGASTQSKVSFVMSDPLNGTNNPKFIPGATVEYCIMVSNSGSATLTAVTMDDPLPATTTYIPASLRSGTSCAAATTAEDDNNSGGDESDPHGAAITGSTITATAPALGPTAGFAIKFNATVN